MDLRKKTILALLLTAALLPSPLAALVAGRRASWSFTSFRSGKPVGGRSRSNIGSAGLCPRTARN